uniref:Nucleoporin 50kDa n=2 Tax=Xenopus tropicalis TaxID=8364 RepID=F7DLP0_XENTR
MAKRIADKELTDRNWDQEEEAEDAGTFSVASQEVMKTREIKKAKRRNLGSDGESGGAFKGFKGLFSGTGASLPSFGNGSSAKPLEGLSNGTSASSTSLFINLKPASESKPTFGSAFTSRPLLGAADKPLGTASTNGERALSTSGAALSKAGNSEYNKHLTSLNCSVRDWIVKHVNTNPLCDLSPIFRDYEKHLSAIEQKYGASSDSGSESDGAAQTKTIPTLHSIKADPIATFSFGSKDKAPGVPVKTPPDSKPQAAAPTFNFGQKVDSSTLSLIGSGGAPSFSFSTGASSLFGKSTGSTASSSQESEPSSNTEGKGDGEEEEEPPKAVIQEVKEDDAFYSKKCKLFYKKDNEFKEKGVGTLHLKPVENKKTQLLVRADTNLAGADMPLLANSDFFSLNPTQTTIALEQPICMFKSAVNVYLIGIVAGAPNTPLYDGNKKVNASTYSGTQGGKTGPYIVAKLPNQQCINIQALSNMADPTQVQSILSKYVVRVGADVTCLTNPNFVGYCNAPLQGNTQYSFKYLFTDSGDIVQSETSWSLGITTVNGKASSTIDTWPGRRSGGMIVLTSILSTLMFFVFIAYVIGFAYSIANGSPAKEVSRHDTQTTAVLQKAQEPGEVTYSSALTGSERYAPTQQA